MVLFWLYLKSQSNKENKGPVLDKRNVVNKAKMLQQRSVVLKGEGARPKEMETIHLVDQTSAPSLFAGQKPRGAPKKREKKEKKDGADAGKASKASEEKREAEQAANAQEKMHLESLVNYMAFNRKEQQRTFLLDDLNPPPPPPLPKKPPAGDDAAEDIKINTATSEKANSEAQMVLRGAIKYQRCDVAKDLYGHLTDSKVEISETTFSLMIEACIVVGDLKDAGDFLMKMEAAGYCPDAELLDKVMDLYSQHKAIREKSPEDMMEPSSPASPPTSKKRGQLSSDAPVFTPPAADRVSDSAESLELSADADVFIPPSAADAEGQQGASGAFNFDAYSEDED